MVVDELFEAICHLSSIVDVIAFIANGVTFGGIPVSSRYDKEFERDRNSFIIRVTRGYLTTAIIYFVVQSVFAMFRGYYDAFEFPTCFAGGALVIAVAVSIKKLPDRRYFNASLLALALLLSAKLLHSTFYFTDRTLRSVHDDTFNFLAMSFIVEMVLLMFCTLIPYLHIVEKKDKFHIYNIWGIEAVDLVSQTVVIQTLCRQRPAEEWSAIVTAYFLIFAVNVVTLAVGAHCILLTQWKSTKLKRFVVAHEVVTDTLSDIPFFVVTLVGRTYIGNVWITLDMVLKGVVFVRGVIWIPSQIADDIDQIPLENASQSVDEMAPNSNKKIDHESQVQVPGPGQKVEMTSFPNLAGGACHEPQDPKSGPGDNNNDRTETPKHQKWLTIIFCVVFTGGIVYALHLYLGWRVEQYEQSLIRYPTAEPTLYPTIEPTTYSPTAPSMNPTLIPTANPTAPTMEPTADPVREPTLSPTANPTAATMEPTNYPSGAPSVVPTQFPSSPLPRYSDAADWILADKYSNLWFFIACLVSVCCLCSCLGFIIYDEPKEEVASVLIGASALCFSLFVTFLVMLCAPTRASAANNWIKGDHYKNVGFLVGFWISFGCLSVFVLLLCYRFGCDGKNEGFGCGAAIIAAFLSFAMMLTFFILMMV